MWVWWNVLNLTKFFQNIWCLFFRRRKSSLISVKLIRPRIFQHPFEYVVKEIFFNLKYVTSVICSPVLGIFTNSKIQHHFIHFFIGIFLFIYFYSLQQKIRCTIIILTIYFFQNCLKLQRGTIIYNYNKPRRQISEIITSRINVKPNAFCYGILTEMVVLWCFP